MKKKITGTLKTRMSKLNHKLRLQLNLGHISVPNMTTLTYGVVTPVMHFHEPADLFLPYNLRVIFMVIIMN